MKLAWAAGAGARSLAVRRGRVDGQAARRSWPASPWRLRPRRGHGRLRSRQPVVSPPGTHVAAPDGLDGLDALEQALPGRDRLEAAHRPQPVLDGDVRALDGLGGLPAGAVQAGAGVHRPPGVAADGAHVGLVLVRDHVVRGGRAGAGWPGRRRRGRWPGPAARAAARRPPGRARRPPGTGTPTGRPRGRRSRRSTSAARRAAPRAGPARQERPELLNPGQDRAGARRRCRVRPAGRARPPGRAGTGSTSERR